MTYVRPKDWTDQGTPGSQLRDSANDFVNLVWPAIKDLPLFGECRLIPVEGNDDRISGLLDRRAGTDYLVVGGGHSARALASRVQWTPDPYDTFTIRTRRDDDVPTEYEKVRLAFREGGIAPAIRVQAYVWPKGGALLTVGVAQEADVFECIEQRVGRERYNKRDAHMWEMRWSEMKRRGFHVDIVDTRIVTAAPVPAPAEPMACSFGVLASLARCACGRETVRRDENNVPWCLVCQATAYKPKWDQ